MNCPTCGHNNPPSSKFCLECGSGLAVPCAQCGAELADLLGTDPSIATLAGPIHARPGGNSFFTEEVAQTLIESGHLQGERGPYRLVTPIEKLAVPATVQAVLAARIDRLPEMGASIADRVREALPF